MQYIRCEIELNEGGEVGYDEVFFLQILKYYVQVNIKEYKYMFTYI